MCSVQKPPTTTKHWGKSNRTLAPKENRPLSTESSAEQRFPTAEQRQTPLKALCTHRQIQPDADLTSLLQQRRSSGCQRRAPLSAASPQGCAAAGGDAQQVSELTAMGSTEGKPTPGGQDLAWTELSSETSPSQPGLGERCGNDLQLPETAPIPVMGPRSCACRAWAAKRPTLALS